MSQKTKPLGSDASQNSLACAEAAVDTGKKNKNPRKATRGSFFRKALAFKGKADKAQASDPALAFLLDDCFFDWYQITLPNSESKAKCHVGGPEEREAVDAAFRWAVAQGLHPGRIGGGHNGYRAAMPFTRDPESKDVVCRVNSGSTSGNMPNIMLTGGRGSCAELAKALQQAFPKARLSRADAALDYSKPSLWDDLLLMAQGISRSNSKLGGVRVIESDTGRTFYLGSRSSTVSLRVYEKDKERAARGLITSEAVDPDLVRIEWTFRPQSKRKAGMAQLSPGELIRSSVWARDFMVRAAAIMRVTDRNEKLSKHSVECDAIEKTLEGTVRHGVHQYGRSFARLAMELLVIRDHDGRHDLAVLDPDEVIDGVAELFAELLREAGVVYRVLQEERLDEAMDPDEWRNSYIHELMEEPDRQDWALERAQEKMRKQAKQVGLAVPKKCEGEAS